LPVFLAGAIAGLIAVALTVPLRRAVSVTDRTIINGLTITLGAIALWTAAGIAYAVQASRSTSAQRRLVIAAAGAAVAISAFIVADVGPLAPYPSHFASLAIPIWLMITLGGAALFPLVDSFASVITNGRPRRSGRRGSPGPARLRKGP